MLMTGDYRYLHPAEIEAFRTEGVADIRDAYWAANSAKIIAEYLAENPGLTEASAGSVVRGYPARPHRAGTRLEP